MTEDITERISKDKEDLKNQQHYTAEHEAMVANCACVCIIGNGSQARKLLVAIGG